LTTNQLICNQLGFYGDTNSVIHTAFYIERFCLFV